MRFMVMGFGILLVGWVLYMKATFKQKQEAPAAMPEAIKLPPTPVLSPAELQKVIDSTRDHDSNVRWEAIKFLNQLNVPQIETIFADKLQRDPDPALRRNILNLITERKSPTTSQMLTMALKDDNPEVRVTALQALAHRGDFATATAISQTLNDSDQRVRLQALSALNALQTKRNDEIRREQERLDREHQEAVRRQKREKGG
ncbi:MAG: HEAT repeat domain-containing protein [Elusimicrobia bacterium]|nr:HEAT repeat domain-containing protein [Elusimicrobiota bacterium]